MRIGNVWVFPLATYQKEHNIAEKKTPWVAFCVFFISLVEFLENLYGNAELHSTLGRLKQNGTWGENEVSLDSNAYAGAMRAFLGSSGCFWWNKKTFRMLHQRCDPVALTEDYIHDLKHFRSYLNPWGNEPICLIFLEWVETAELE